MSELRRKICSRGKKEEVEVSLEERRDKTEFEKILEKFGGAIGSNNKKRKIGGEDDEGKKKVRKMIAEVEREMKDVEVPHSKSKGKYWKGKEEIRFRKDSNNLGRNWKLGEVDDRKREEERNGSGTGILGAKVTEVTFLSNRERTIYSRGENESKEEVQQFKNKRSPVTERIMDVGERREVGRVERLETAPSREWEGYEKEVFGRSDREDNEADGMK